MSWFGWIVLIAAVGGVLWWLSGSGRTAVRTAPDRSVSRELTREEGPEDGRDNPGAH